MHALTTSGLNPNWFEVCAQRKDLKMWRSFCRRRILFYVCCLLTWRIYFVLSFANELTEVVLEPVESLVACVLIILCPYWSVILYLLSFLTRNFISTNRVYALVLLWRQFCVKS